MVAMVSGTGLGLDLTSARVLGGQGIAGDASFGTGGQKVYVNTATGNLVLQQQQDAFVGLGPEFDPVLTYNSLGQLNGAYGYRFTMGAVTGQLVLSGQQGQAGSTVTVTQFDGSQEVYAWDGTRYASKAGGGAYDSLTYAADTGLYTRVDGASQQTEIYDGATGQLKSRADAQGNTIAFAYTAGQLTGVTHTNLVNGVPTPETLTFAYDPTTHLLASISAPTDVLNADGSVTTTTRKIVDYGYASGTALLTSPMRSASTPETISPVIR